MLKRPITYMTFEDEPKEVTEPFYFNLSKREIGELDLAHGEDTFETWYKKVIAENNRQALYEFFKKLLLSAYGERSEDGKQFIKNEALREKFSQSAAYEALFDEFASNDTALFDFFRGILPKDMAGNWDEAVKQARAESEKTPTT